MSITTLISQVKQPQYYVPRDYKTIGGMWTIDTWKRDEITVQVMDEGYTTRVRGPGFEALISWSAFDKKDVVTYSKGDEQVVESFV